MEKFLKTLESEKFKKKLSDVMYDAWFGEDFYLGLNHLPKEQKEEFVKKIKTMIVDDIVTEIVKEVKKEN